MVNRPRRTQAERRAATRAEVLAAAERVISDHGFVAASVDEIAKAAGLTKGAVYHHFASKEELLLELLEACFRERIEAFDRMAAARSAGRGQGIAAGESFDRSWNVLFLEFVVRAAHDEDFGREFRHLLEQLRERRAAAAHRILNADASGTSFGAEELATVMCALANGLAIEALIRPHLPSAALYTATLKMLLQGLSAAPKTSSV